MKRFVWLCGIMLASHIAGCASLNTSPGTAKEQIDYWLDRQEYGKALAVVTDSKNSPSTAIPNLQETQEKISAHIASYEQQVIAKAEKAAATNDWGTAFDLYRDALSRVPDSTPLQQGEQQLIQRHAEHLQSLELERLIAKGEWTLKDLETSKVAEADKSGSWLGRYLLNRKIANAHDLGLELAEYGKSALERKDLPLAKRILPLALNLSNTTEIRALNTQLQEALKPEARKEEDARIPNEPPRIAEKPLPAPRARAEVQTKEQTKEQTREERPATHGQEQKDTKRLMDEFRKACQEKNFVEAQQLMSQLKKQGVDTQEFQKLSKQLASDVATHVKNLIKIGVIHYRQQQYDEALNVWKQAQVLDPNNEQLTARIKRVTRVTESLQNLRTKGGAPQ
jgi:tetratricopeptide (TPR) repeat protein